MKVRRANSAKVSTSSSIKSQNQFNDNSDPRSSVASSIKSKRSLSQPSGLDVIVCDNAMMSNLDKIKHIDDDDDDDESDTDSMASNRVEDIEDDRPHGGILYAEVLYHFQAGGPQELSLEKGALVEILRRETGPWWWGRTKYDAVISGSESLEIHQGWFPKDFVKILPAFGNKAKFISQTTSKDCDNHHHPTALPPTSAVPSITSSQSSNEIMRDNVIKELLETEINYVKLLNSLCDG